MRRAPVSRRLMNRDRTAAAWRFAAEICDEDVAVNHAIGAHGLELDPRDRREEEARRAVNILTHCNAGWLATVDWGTATSPIYQAATRVSTSMSGSTRPGRATRAPADRLGTGSHGMPHHADRRQCRRPSDAARPGRHRHHRHRPHHRAGDVCNKIGTYLKALAAKDNDVPFYVALPSSTIDWTVRDGVREIPIEERAGEEVTWISGRAPTAASTRCRSHRPMARPRQPGLRRHPGASGHRPDHRARPLVEAGLDAAVGDLERQTDFRRSPQGAADVSVILKGRVDGAARKALGAVFEAWPAVESARLSKNRLTLRFTEETLQRVAEGLAAHPHDPLRLAGTASGTRVVVDYLDPNANKALHVGHLRNIALGGALAALWRARGADVACQSVVCDIGRNIAEALAGVSAAGGLSALKGSGPVDRIVGRLYGEIAGAVVTEEGGAEADAPIARELTLHGDAADATLAAWRAGDPATLALWRDMIDLVLRDQAATLARLGQRHDTFLRESDAVGPALALADRLIDVGLARREDDGVVILETGRDDYPRCPLTRSDGFATEHLRALVLWLEAANGDAPAPDRVLHVMGEEWLTSTEIRLDALRALGAGAFFDRYRMLPHQLVRLDGSTMKSSSGNTLLIDDLIDTLANTLPAALAALPDAARDGAVAALALTPFLIAEAGVALEIDLATLTDPVRNPGFDLAALALIPSAGPAAPLGDAGRFALFQGERLRRVLIQACERDDPVAPARFLARLAQARRDGEIGAEADAVLQPQVRAAMTACGLLPSLQA
jgi:hypothetical protein